MKHQAPPQLAGSTEGSPAAVRYVVAARDAPLGGAAAGCEQSLPSSRVRRQAANALPHERRANAWSAWSLVQRQESAVRVQRQTSSPTGAHRPLPSSRVADSVTRTIDREGAWFLEFSRSGHA